MSDYLAQVDLDCFYCQVEIQRNPSLRGYPLAVVRVIHNQPNIPFFSTQLLYPEFSIALTFKPLSFQITGPVRSLFFPQVSTFAQA
jgi:hypothetical protein